MEISHILVMHERSWPIKRNLFFLTEEKAQCAKCGGWVQLFRAHRTLNETACSCDSSPHAVVWEAGDPSEGCTPVILPYAAANKGPCLRGEVRTNLRLSLVSTCAHPHHHMQACTKTYVHYTTHIYKYKRNMFFLQEFFSFLVNFQNSSYSVYLYSFH